MAVTRDERAEAIQVNVEPTPLGLDLARPAGLGTLVQIRNVVKTYGQGRGGHGRPIVAVDDVSLEIARGETLGIVGESGSGKSTIAKIVMGLERPDSGTVVIDGIDVFEVRGSDRRALQRRRQLVFQDPRSSLNRRRTVRQCIEAPLIVHGIASGERKTRVGELLELVGLNPAHGSAYPGQLSGGQAQRVAIARALALNPDVILLDEAVSSLDVSVQAQVLNLLRDLQARLGMSYLFIAHDLAVVRFMATRIAVMKAGQVVEHADRDALFAAPEHEYTRCLLDAIPEPPARRDD